VSASARALPSQELRAGRPILLASGADPQRSPPLLPPEYSLVHAPDIVTEHLDPALHLGPLLVKEPLSSNAPTSAPPKSASVAPLSTGELQQQLALSLRPPLSEVLSLHDFESIARQVMSARGWAYYSSGADDESTMRENRGVYGRVWMRPRVLRNVVRRLPAPRWAAAVALNRSDRFSTVHSSTRPTSTTQRRSSARRARCRSTSPRRSVSESIRRLRCATRPLTADRPLASQALGKLGHPDGELNLTRAGGKHGVIQMVRRLLHQPLAMSIDAFMRHPQIPTLASCSFDELVDGAIDGQSQFLQLSV
jgi:L-lactate dehydrogenase (cytochrome)